MKNLNKEAEALISSNIDLVNKYIDKWIKEEKAKKTDVLDFDALLKFISDTTGIQRRVFHNNLKTKYRARLKDGYTKEDIANAVRNAVKESVHIDSGNKHLTLEFFTRYDILDKYSVKSKTDSEGIKLNMKTK
jgi:hypothetical protein